MDRWAVRAGVTLAAGLLVVTPEWTVIALREGGNGFATGAGYVWRAAALASILPASWLVVEFVYLFVPATWIEQGRRRLAYALRSRVGHVAAYALWFGGVFVLSWALSVSLWKDLDLPALVPGIDWEAQAGDLLSTIPSIAATGVVLGAAVGVVSAWRRGASPALPWLYAKIGPILIVTGMSLALVNIARPMGYFAAFHPIVMVLGFWCFLLGLTLANRDLFVERGRLWGRFALGALPSMALIGVWLLTSGLGTPSASSLRVLDKHRPLASKIAVAAFAAPSRGTALSCPEPSLKSVELSDTVPERELADLMFVTVDALAAAHVGVLGNKRDATPNFDRLAREGALFESAQSTGSATAVGVPGIQFSRPFECLGDPVSGELPSVFKALKEAGYRTAAFYGYPMGQGVTASYSDALLRPFDRREFRGDDPSFPNMVSPDEMVAAGAIDEVVSASPNQPLAMWIHFYNPHPVYNPPASVRGYFGSGQRARYDEEVLATDAAFGQVWDRWSSARPGKDLMILMTADHGQAVGQLGEHGHATSLVHSMVAVPLILAGPGLTPTRVSRPVSTLDIGPTVLELLGLPIPQGFLGQSLVPDLAGPMPDVPIRMTRSSTRKHLVQEAVVLGRYKLYREPRPKYGLLYPQPEFYALYDLLADPRERRNLVDKNPEVVERMKPLLLSRVYASSEDNE